MSNSLDQDQAKHNVGPYLGPNCLQRLSADKSPQAGKAPVTATINKKYCDLSFDFWRK